MFDKRQPSPSRYFASEGKIDKSANRLAGHGQAGLKKNVLDPRAVNELDFESYGQFRPEISRTVPSLRCTLSSAPVNIETDACWFPKKLRPLCDKSLTKLKSNAPPLSANVATPKVLIFELELDNATAAVMFETRHPIQ